MSRRAAHLALVWLFGLGVLGMGSAGSLVAVQETTPQVGSRLDLETPGDGDRDGNETTFENGTMDPVAPGDVATAPTLPTEELFFSANAAYEDAEYARAAELYEQVITAGGTGGAVHYNLGNAYLRSGQLGLAIASYLRARASLPREQDVLANLEYARNVAKDAIEPPAPSEAMRNLFFWHYNFSASELWIGVLVLNLLVWLFLAARLFSQSAIWKWLAVACGTVLLCVASSAIVHSAGLSEVAVIVPQEVDVTYGTDEDSVVRFKLHAGTEVRVVERSPGWVKIRLPDDLEGWIPQTQVEVVRL